ncbi:MAG: hypothetical protein CML46_12555 [Rhodobacteraceae bacterium]|nr:hypothetical protein [Paracoccaceae bacterium]MBR27758.1 hypothetical protein [Paracoccaceae bacterium]
MQDVIERSLELSHTPSRVRRAPADPARFTISGHEPVRYACEGVGWTPKTVFAWRWNPPDPEEGADPLSGSCTLVRFEIAPTAGGARLTVVESGFAAHPARARRGIPRRECLCPAVIPPSRPCATGRRLPPEPL